MIVTAAAKRDDAHLSAVLNIYLEPSQRVPREDITFNGPRMEFLSILLHVLTEQHSSTQYVHRHACSNMILTSYYLGFRTPSFRVCAGYRIIYS